MPQIVEEGKYAHKGPKSVNGQTNWTVVTPLRVLRFSRLLLTFGSCRKVRTLHLYGRGAFQTGPYDVNECHFSQ